MKFPTKTKVFICFADSSPRMRDFVSNFSIPGEVCRLLPGFLTAERIMPKSDDKSTFPFCIHIDDHLYGVSYWFRSVSTSNVFSVSCFCSFPYLMVLHDTCVNLSNQMIRLYDNCGSLPVFDDNSHRILNDCLLNLTNSTGDSLPRIFFPIPNSIDIFSYISRPNIFLIVKLLLLDSKIVLFHSNPRIVSLVVIFIFQVVYIDLNDLFSQFIVIYPYISLDCLSLMNDRYNLLGLSDELNHALLSSVDVKFNLETNENIYFNYEKTAVTNFSLELESRDDADVRVLIHDFFQKANHDRHHPPDNNKSIFEYLSSFVISDNYRLFLNQLKANQFMMMMMNDNDNNASSSSSLEEGCLYEGDMLNGQRSGTGRLIMSSSSSSYSGQFLNNLYHGNGILCTKAYIYDGEFKMGVKHGVGTWSRIDVDDDVYKGEWLNDVKSGVGHYHWSGVEIEYDYNGDWSNDVMSGEGRLSCYYHHSLVYEFDGNWLDGHATGYGNLKVNYTQFSLLSSCNNSTRRSLFVEFESEVSYQSSWMFAFMSSVGTVFVWCEWLDNHAVQGQWEIKSKHDDNTDDDVIYTGQVSGRVKLLPNGNGIIKNISTTQEVYSGQFLNGKKHGVGLIVSKSGKARDVVFRNDVEVLQANDDDDEEEDDDDILFGNGMTQVNL